MTRNPMFRRANGDFCGEENAEFDLIIVKAVNSGHERIVPHSIQEVHAAVASGEMQRRVAKLRTSLAEAKSIAAALTQGGGKGLIIPSCYAEPIVSFHQAEAIAEREYERELSLRNTPLGPLRPGPYEDFLAWLFFAEDPEQDKAQIPGGIFIEVDTSDGHILSDDDRAAWVRLQEAQD